MNVYGLTGQTGAGKTTVLQVFQKQGALVIDCDVVYWELLQCNRSLQEELHQAFGDICHESGQVDRKKLGAVVFAQEEKLLQLNQITHPYVLEKVEEIIQEAQSKQEKSVVIDAISLIESGLNRHCDVVFGVVASESRRISRIMERDGITFAYAKSRVQAQKPQSFFEDNVNEVIENNFDELAAFQRYVEDFFIRINCNNN